MQNKRNITIVVLLGIILALGIGPVTAAPPAQGDPAVAKLHEINGQLQAMGLNIRAVEIHFFSIGQGRPDARILQQEIRWVPYDPLRGGRDNLTYVVDQSNGATASGLSSAQTEAAIDNAMGTWDVEKCLRNVDIAKLPDQGGDYTIFDALFGFGMSGNPLYADIVNAGWYEKAFFDAVTGAGENVLAFSVSFIWVDGNGNPTDFNNDGYLDTALNEVYYNDYFGEGGGSREDNPWGIDISSPGVDVETVALHENGHSIALGHFGPPPRSVMNPVYAGIQQVLLPPDHAGVCTQFARWPNK